MVVDPEQTFTLGNLDLDADGVADGVFSNNASSSDHQNRVFEPDALMLKYAHPDDDGINISSATGVNIRICAPSGLSKDDQIWVASPDTPPIIRAIELTSNPVACSESPVVYCAPSGNCEKFVYAPSAALNPPGGFPGLTGGRVLLNTNIYYVGTDSNGYPTLFRIHNYKTPHSIIAFGIVDLQIEYGLPGADPITGEKVINYTTAPATVQDVEMVKVTLTGETRNSHKISSGPDGISQRSITTEIQVRNLFY
jgi:hypothetical protein